MILYSGPILRVTPWEVHVKDVGFLDEIYASSSRNREKYSFQTRTLKVPLSMGGSIKHDLHRRRREAANPFFSKKGVIDLEPMIGQKVKQLCQLMDDRAEQRIPVNLSDVYFAFANECALPFQVKCWSGFCL